MKSKKSSMRAAWGMVLLAEEAHRNGYHYELERVAGVLRAQFGFRQFKSVMDVLGESIDQYDCPNVSWMINVDSIGERVLVMVDMGGSYG